MPQILFPLILVCLVVGTLVVAVGPSVVRRRFGRYIPKVDPNYFSCRVLHIEEETREGYSDIYRVQIRGRIVAPIDHCHTDLLVGLADITDTVSVKPVLSRRQDRKQKDNPAFEYRQDNGTLPAKDVILSDWVTVVEMKLGELFFARRGPRSMECSVSVVADQPQKVIANAKCQVPIVFECLGYEEIHHEKQTRRNALQLLAVQVWDLSGRSDTGRAILEQWQQAQPAGSVPPLEEVLAQAEKMKSTEESPLEKGCDDLMGWADTGDRLTVMELCLKVAAEGSTIQKEQTQTLDRIAQLLELSEDRYHALRQKYLTGQLDQVEDPMVLLGLREDMTEEAIQQKLTAEYRKWNSRVTHPDADVRQQADQMLNLIMDLRNKYKQASKG